MTEFGFIESIRRDFARLPANGFEGIGDDCAVLPLEGGRSLLFSSDALNEGVHFLRGAMSAAEIGAKSVMVNLSDIAAMGGRPVATLLSLSLTEDAAQGWAQEFMRGYREVCERYGVALVGGDTTRSKSHISINVTVIGEVADGCIKRRSDARADDIVVVGGRLGASAAGLRDILEGRTSTPAAVAHRRPQAQVREGEWLGKQPCVHAMMDLSDGLASDLCHILKASSVGARIDTECIPTDSTLEDALCGGEDYKLLFTVAPEGLDALKRGFSEVFGYDIYPVGRIVGNEAGEIEWLEKGARTDHDFRGYSHF